MVQTRRIKDPHQMVPSQPGASGLRKKRTWEESGQASERRREDGTRRTEEAKHRCTAGPPGSRHIASWSWRRINLSGQLSKFHVYTGAVLLKFLALRAEIYLLELLPHPTHLLELNLLFHHLLTPLDNGPNYNPPFLFCIVLFILYLFSSLSRERERGRKNKT